MKNKKEKRSKNPKFVNSTFTKEQYEGKTDRKSDKTADVPTPELVEDVKDFCEEHIQ